MTYFLFVYSFPCKLMFVLIEKSNLCVKNIFSA